MKPRPSALSVAIAALFAVGGIALACVGIRGALVGSTSADAGAAVALVGVFLVAFAVVFSRLGGDDDGGSASADEEVPPVRRRSAPRVLGTGIGLALGYSILRLDVHLAVPWALLLVALGALLGGVLSRVRRAVA